MIGVYAGTFDPITMGHIDILNRANKLCDKLIIAVAQLNDNKRLLFSAKERVEMIRRYIEDNKIEKVEVKSFSGLLVNFAKQVNAKVIIRGLRAVTDFEYEFQLSLMNKYLAEDIDTIFLMTNSKYAFLSSSIIKEIAKLGGDIDDFVTPYVKKKLLEKLK